MPRFTNPVPQYLDSAGNPLPGGKVYFYETTTTTPKDTFSDEAESVANANPVILDAEGRCGNIWYTGVARVILQTSSGVEVYDRDPVGSAASTSSMAAYNAGTTYSADDTVLATDGNFYISLAGSNLNNEPSASPTVWSELATIRVWNTNETYADLEVVRGSDGNLYRSTTGTNLANDPTTDNQNWLMAIDDSRILSDLNGTLTSGGSSNAYTLTPDRYAGAYAAGMMYRFKANHSNTGACTLNVAGLGAKALQSSTAAAMVSGNIKSGRYYTAFYTGVYFVLTADLSPGEFERQPVAYLDFTLNGTATPTINKSLGATVIMDIANGTITVTLGTALAAADDAFIDMCGAWLGVFTFSIPVVPTFRATSTTLITGLAYLTPSNTAALTDARIWLKVYDYS